MAKKKIYVYTVDKKLRGILVKETDRGYLARGWRYSKNNQKIPTVRFYDKRKSVLLIHDRDIDDYHVLKTHLSKWDGRQHFKGDMYSLVKYYNKLRNTLPCDVYITTSEGYNKTYHINGHKELTGIALSEQRFIPIVVAMDLPIPQFQLNNTGAMFAPYSSKTVLDAGAFYAPYVPIFSYSK